MSGEKLTEVMSEDIERASEMLERCRQLEQSHEENQHMYDEWCSTYDEDNIILKRTGHKSIAQVVTDIYPLNRESISILDMACGTGAVGEELQHHGFKIIDGLDANENMMKIARKKNVHRKEFVEPVPEEGQTSIVSDVYDVVTCCGGLGSGALPVNFILEMIRVVKPTHLKDQEINSSWTLFGNNLSYNRL